MNLDDVRSLKERWAPRVPRGVALGVVPRGSEFGLAVRIQRPTATGSAWLECLRREARDALDVRRVGPVLACERHRPLPIGCSIGGSATTGTLGCFVRRLEAPSSGCWALSNAHVLAEEPAAGLLFSPAGPDGAAPEDAIARRSECAVPLTTCGVNRVDCAIARIERGVDVDRAHIPGLGPLSGWRASSPRMGEVYKRGRTTGLTRGRMTAFEVDGLLVQIGASMFAFDGQLEFESASGRPFSCLGDSGALIVSAAGDGTWEGVALLFAISMTGAAGGWATYANPIEEVARALAVAPLL